MRGMGTIRRRLAAAIAGTAALAAAGCRLDDRFLYDPRPTGIDTWRATAARTRAEPVELRRDGAVLRGWWLRPPGAAGRGPAVTYFGGNAEEPSWLLAHVGRLGGRSLLVVPYRGYGASTGAPHERALYDDALALHDWLAARPDVDPGRIAAWGNSLGTGVATWLASRRTLDAVILSSPYDSIAALARHHLPALAFLLTQPYDSIGRAPSIRTPMLAIAGLRDTIVPPEHGERLVAAWGGPVRVLRLPLAAHDDLPAHDEHWREVAAMLADPRAATPAR